MVNKNVKNFVKINLKLLNNLADMQTDKPSNQQANRCTYMTFMMETVHAETGGFDSGTENAVCNSVDAVGVLCTKQIEQRVMNGQVVADQGLWRCSRDGDGRVTVAWASH